MSRFLDVSGALHFWLSEVGVAEKSPTVVITFEGEMDAARAAFKLAREFDEVTRQIPYPKDGEMVREFQAHGIKFLINAAPKRRAVGML